MSGMFFKLLEKFLKQCSHDDLIGILRAVDDFVRDMRDILDAENSKDFGIGVGPNGSGIDNRSSGFGEIDASEVPFGDLVSDGSGIETARED